MVRKATEPLHPQTHGTLTLRTNLILHKIAENIIEKKNQLELKIRVQRSPLLEQGKVLELTSHIILVNKLTSKNGLPPPLTNLVQILHRLSLYAP